MRMPGLMTTLLALAPVPVLAQAASPVEVINADAARSEVAVQHLRGGVSVLAGSGGNIAVLADPDGKFLVDAGIAVSKEKIARALATLGAGGVKYVVNAHWHWDHAAGNVWLHDAGSQIMASENTLKYLSATRHRLPPELLSTLAVVEALASAAAS